MGKKLYRSRDNKMVFGVFGGLGEYFNIDATLLRLAWVVVAVLTGFVPAVVAYVVAGIIIPEEPLG